MGGNLADRIDAAAAGAPGADAVVVDAERWSHTRLAERSIRLAAVLAGRGVGPHDRVGLLLDNGIEHVEALLACFRLRAVPVNLNTRYVAAELAEVLDRGRVSLVLHEPDLEHLLPADLARLATGAVYEAALAAADPAAAEIAVPAASRSGDDHYLLFTGGTTSRPKGVLWRHGDLHVAALAGHLRLDARRVLVASPLCHGTGQWLALATLLAGGAVVLSRERRLDAAALLELADRERVSHLVVVGDAFLQPLVEALDGQPGRWHLDELTVVLSGGAPLSPAVARRLLEHLPCAMVVDGYGATETGGHARAVHVAGGSVERSVFRVDGDTAVLDEELHPLPPGDPTEGWLARRGALPLGYDGDDEATARTFPTIDGVRWAVPGDRARWVGTDRVEIFGRDALTINTGGEKVHAEEVEAVLRSHPQVADVAVVGTPDERWGQVVTAVVAPRPGAAVPDVEDLVAHCRGAIAGFKAPRRIVPVDAVRRTLAGKPDYRWAREVAGA